MHLSEGPSSPVGPSTFQPTNQSIDPSSLTISIVPSPVVAAQTGDLEVVASNALAAIPAVLTSSLAAPVTDVTISPISSSPAPSVSPSSICHSNFVTVSRSGAPTSLTAPASHTLPSSSLTSPPSSPIITSSTRVTSSSAASSPATATATPPSTAATSIPLGSPAKEVASINPIVTTIVYEDSSATTEDDSIDHPTSFSDLIVHKKVPSNIVQKVKALTQQQFEEEEEEEEEEEFIASAQKLKRLAFLSDSRAISAQRKANKKTPKGAIGCSPSS